MKTQVECFNVLFVVLLAGAFVALPSPAHSEPMSSGDLQPAQERIRLLVNKPIELATATKEAVRSLDPENRKALRSSLAQQALVATNLEDRLALLNVVVDATTWTNAAERSLSDPTLASSLKQVYQQDPHTALRDRAAVALALLAIQFKKLRRARIHHHAECAFVVIVVVAIRFRLQ